jgi:O-antigen chain-terminating methyltransferase
VADEPEELAAIVREIRERVRARRPDGDAAGLTLPGLLPVEQARDAAQGKAAAIGSVNPRPPGLLNSAIQGVKRFVARALYWHVREQVNFNRATVAGIGAILEALHEHNRILSQLAVTIEEADNRTAESRQELADIRSHWAEWRLAWDRQRAITENELLRAVAELKAGFDFRMAQVSEDIQRSLWADLERIRGEYERLIHTELRLVRQRAALPALPPVPAAAPPAAPALEMDYGRFAERFRGPEEYVRERQRFYLRHFEGCREVLDLGCGRGEFLEVMKEAGIPARGVELSPELVAVCRAKDLAVEMADLLEYLPALPDESLDGVFSAHVIEHLPPERLPGLVRAAAAKLRRGGVVAFETPNPECLAIFATHFYLDPTHVRPVPHGLLNFYLEEAGFGRIELHRLAPAIEGAPSLASVPEDFRNTFFGGQDYAVIARKL